MKRDNRSDPGRADGSGADPGYAWLRDGSMPQTREDLVAEAVAFVALLFSLAIGILVAVLPESAAAQADGPLVGASAQAHVARADTSPR